MLYGRPDDVNLFQLIRVWRLGKLNREQICSSTHAYSRTKDTGSSERIHDTFLSSQHQVGRQEMFISSGARLSPAYYLSSLCKTWVACTMQERPELRTENKADYFPFLKRVQPCVFTSKQESGAVQGGKRESQHCLVGDVQTLKYKAKSSGFFQLCILHKTDRSNTKWQNIN